MKWTGVLESVSTTVHRIPGEESICDWILPIIARHIHYVSHCCSGDCCHPAHERPLPLNQSGDREGRPGRNKGLCNTTFSICCNRAIRIELHTVIRHRLFEHSITEDDPRYLFITSTFGHVDTFRGGFACTCDHTFRPNVRTNASNDGIGTWVETIESCSTPCSTSGRS